MSLNTHDHYVFHMHLMFDHIFNWTQRNLDVVFFVYGLAFVTMGIAILVQPKKGSAFKLSNILWILAGFGLIHGANELLDMWAIIKGEAPLLNMVRSLMLVISYLFLFEFGRQLFRICEQEYLKKLTTLFSGWLVVIVAVNVFIFGFIPGDFWKTETILARYFLGFPGGLLTCRGLILYYRHKKKELEPIRVKKYFFSASLFFLGYGILGGLIVPKTDFFPANLINTDSFLSLVHVPVQVFRGLCAMAIAWAVCGMLRIFKWEAIEKLEIRIRERTQELTRANELLKVEIVERRQAEDELKKAYTKLKDAQGQLIQAEKMNAVGQLASGVAHEVRNPLGIILQGVGYLQDRLSPQEKDVSETLTMLKNSVKRADKIINALLDFSRPTSLSLQPEDINSILDNSVSLVKAQLKFENVEIAQEIKTVIPKVVADKNKLEQVFINILLNAIQAMPQGGKITIRSYDKVLEEIKKGIGSRSEDSFKVGERAVMVEFEDTGIGISEGNIEKIFNPFFTTKGPQGGTGLGLSVSRNILHMHKGLIRITSQPGQGTKITIILKIAES